MSSHFTLAHMQKFLMSIKSDEPNISTGKPVGYIGIVIILMYVTDITVSSRYIYDRLCQTEIFNNNAVFINKNKRYIVL